MTTYTQALEAGEKIGASRATDAQASAMFCATALQILCGAVSPELVWDGAQRKGLSLTQLARLAQTDQNAIQELMWS